MKAEIINTRPGDPNFHFFEKLPKQLYPADSFRHQQPDSINMEFLHSCFVLPLDGEPKTRLALYDNPHLFYQGRKAACIGNYESIDDLEISGKLLNFAITEAKKNGAEFLIGPMNGSTWDNYRFSTHHNHPSFLLEPFHHLYYNTQFNEAGFSPVSKYISCINKEIDCDAPDLLRREDELIKAGVKIRNINMNDYKGELEKLHPFISSAFKSNFLYTPISGNTFRNKYIEAGKIINPEYVCIAEDNRENIIGFIFCYDDLYNATEKSLVIKTLARSEAKQWKGLGQVMSNAVIRKVKNKNYHSIIHAFMKEEGTSIVTSKAFHGAIYKNYVLYGKEI